MDQQTATKKKDKTERVIRLGRRTRKETVKWNQMTVLRFQTGGDIRHPQPPFGGKTTVLPTKQMETKTHRTGRDYARNIVA